MGNSNRVFVSPGVYTSEKDLTFVAQSVGVTTLGLVGETLKGPAFEPILITNFDEFKTYFGPTSPLKDGNSNPKYELSYVAKSYLQESNQLFVTRVLGLTGYKPVRTFHIETLAGISYDSATPPSETSEGGVPPADMSGSIYYADLSGKTATTGDSIPEWLADHSAFTENDWFTIGLVPDSAITNYTAGVEIEGPIGDFTNYVFKTCYNGFSCYFWVN